MTFDYKKYSLEQLENWISDAISATDTSPEEIYDVITKVVLEQLDYFKLHSYRCEKLLSLLSVNANSDDAWKKHAMPPWGHSDMEALQYSDEELNAMCDSAELQEKSKMTHDEAIAAGWVMSDDGFWIPPQKKDKVIKWILPVEEGIGEDNDSEYFINFPDDLLEASNLKEGDKIQWIDNNDGSYTLRKYSNEEN